MATNLDRDLSCSICLDVYQDPVLLRCGHNFCRVCIQRYIEESEEPLCPHCREEFEEDSLYPNLQLANLIEGVLELRANAEAQADKPQCVKHKEEFKLFCRDDNQLICLMCALSPDHKSHTYLPKVDAYNEYKDILKHSITLLEEEVKDLMIMRMAQGQKISELLDTTESLREDIAGQFEAMHYFLNEKECAIIQKLADEEDRVLKKLEENVFLLSRDCDKMEAAIRDIRMVVNSQDSYKLLQEYGSLKKRSESMYCPVLNSPTCNLDEFYGPLQYAAWKQMKNIIKTVPKALHFDARTANPRLCTSNLGRKLEYCRTPSKLSDTPVRFTNHLSVVASVGFTSGIHYWEVNVGEDAVWFLGVAAASANRKVEVAMKPEHGYWTIQHKNGGDYWAYGKNKIAINPDINLEKIGIYLDYGKGQLSFYDAEDMSHIHTFNDTFKEILYPYFRVNCNKQDEIPPLELFHLQL